MKKNKNIKEKLINIKAIRCEIKVLKCLDNITKHCGAKAELNEDGELIENANLHKLRTRKIEELQAIVEEVETFINNIEDAEEKELLHDYFILEMTHEKIAEKLFIDTSNATKKINKILNKLD